MIVMGSVIMKDNIIAIFNAARPMAQAFPWYYHFLKFCNVDLFPFCKAYATKLER